MSDPFRIAIVAEGGTDLIVIRSVLESILPADRELVLNPLQPETSRAFDAGPLGGGWHGVYRWCHQVKERPGGRLRDDIVLEQHHAIIIHIDADVAGASQPEFSDGLPCECPCPPASDTVDALRAAMLAWLGENQLPERAILCIPSKSTEAWVLTALAPEDEQMQQYGSECHPDPASRLPRKRPNKIRKSQIDYEARSEALRQRWPAVAAALGEAARFDREIRSALSE